MLPDQSSTEDAANYSGSGSSETALSISTFSYTTLIGMADEETCHGEQCEDDSTTITGSLKEILDFVLCGICILVLLYLIHRLCKYRRNNLPVEEQENRQQNIELPFL
ncbi:unnamed protein product [Clavelina lepadiformis]|uniref:Uncharacterized protein n=1 Tax=Clavelina lepadiformis TaxID=159417 RepID=A0ABP0FRP9_CLALP